ncbi:hypothetical protein AMS68_002377 [Peltaster fructicola]|uniref:DUF7918 domain-containing protein n=1 Tax=Peltaster fructicola TaxID=286661 RepID=A0A6H0XQW6_9PEZI|nr:hypothetical protein AMS68_002377 [Peltaster fructicola]
MVRHPGIPGVSVSIRVDGVALKEYQDPQVRDNADEVVRYIQSTNEAIFDIEVSVDGTFRSPATHLRFECRVDGVRVQRPSLELDQKEHSTVSKGKQISPNLLKPYCFGKLDLTTEHRTSDQAQKAQERCKDLGTIRVIATPKKALYQTVPRYSEHDDIISSVHGKDAAKMSLDHFIEFASPMTSYTGSVWHCEDVGNQKFSFVFHYRSKSTLQLLDFLPEDLNSADLLQKPAAKMTTAEVERMQQLLRQTTARESTSASTRRALISGDATPRKKVKVEVADDVVVIEDDKDDED